MSILSDENREKVGLAIGALMQAQAALYDVLRIEDAREADEALDAADTDLERAANHLEGVSRELLVLYSERSWAHREREERGIPHPRAAA